LEGGTLYGADASNLYTVNTTTGAATLVAPLTGGPGGYVYGLAPLPVPLPPAAFLFPSALGLLGLRRKRAT
jgi:hypothetical protein